MASGDFTAKSSPQRRPACSLHRRLADAADVDRVALFNRRRSLTGDPAFDRLARWNGESFGLRPNLTPFAMARLGSFPVRSRMMSRSNSATPQALFEAACPVVRLCPRADHRGCGMPRHAMSILSRRAKSSGGRPANPVQLADHHHVGLLERCHQFGELRPVGASAADLLGEDALDHGPQH